MPIEPRIDLLRLFEAVPGIHVVVTSDPDHVMVAVSDERCRATMTGREDVIGKRLFDVFPDNPADNSSTGAGNLRASLAHVAATGTFHRMALQRYDIRRPDGTFDERWWQPFNAFVPGANDRGAYILHTVEDVTASVQERRAAADALNAERDRRHAISESMDERTAELHQAVIALREEAAERKRAEEALLQSQKMEAVGQLTGGIAHDFNNMLQAIGGSLEMLQRRVEQGRAGEAMRFVDSARTTVARAAALTSRLLTFARRQALQPKPVVADALIRGMEELLCRTVGPAVTVELQMCDGTWPVLCDPNQLENALLNLAINARDAMPDGGQLTITSRHVRLPDAAAADQERATPGDFVEIEVADTGTGMDEATKARAFEPFFTTKPIGQGTGLGLSQLYGFVRQSGGVVQLDSAPSQGTTVRVFLPRHEHVQHTENAPAPDAEAPKAGAGETVLLVEDEAQVRTMAAEHLRDLGYAVLEAANGPAALQALRLGRHVDLLVTDVGLPGGMNGRQVADAARERLPGLPALFITGYAGSVLQEQLAPGMDVIGKPFSLNLLSDKIRTMLDAARRRST
ncbi:MAG: response regulator [Oxalobacteraceae bacterium]|nr:MAG: response regulator [Oxalobacteraceae bacterium]